MGGRKKIYRVISLAGVYKIYYGWWSGSSGLKMTRKEREMQATELNGERNCVEAEAAS